MVLLEARHLQHETAVQNVFKPKPDLRQHWDGDGYPARILYNSVLVLSTAQCREEAGERALCVFKGRASRGHGYVISH